MTAEECVREYNHGLLRPTSPDNSAMSVSVRFARVNHASLIFGISRLRLFRALLFYDSRDKTSAEKQATNGFMSVGKAAKKKNFASLSRAEPVSRSPLLLFFLHNSIKLQSHFLFRSLRDDLGLETRRKKTTKGSCGDDDDDGIRLSGARVKNQVKLRDGSSFFSTQRSLLLVSRVFHTHTISQHVTASRCTREGLSIRSYLD